MKLKPGQKTIVIAVLLSTVYALALRYLFGHDSWDSVFEVMSFTFLFLLPSILGALVVYLSPRKQAASWTYRITMPWLPIFLFVFGTLAFGIEGWACWIMILPIFLLAATIGGIIGGKLKCADTKSDKLNLSILVLLPFAISPLEQAIEMIPATYEAKTYIDINAPAEVIWSNVTRVKEIPENLDTGTLNRTLGFPRPVKAELNYEGVGAYRKAIFTNGLVFHETVTKYDHQKQMVFTIEAYPYEIPSTTLDEHVVIGGDYFDVLEGEYRLEQLGRDRYRLHLTSSFKLSTSFNFYAGLWAKWIMSDIQDNILKIEKLRSEKR